MDMSSRPTYLEASTQDSLKSARSFVSRCRALDNNRGLVVPVLTPRFVPTCSNDLLEGLGKLSEEENVQVQSHLAEAHDEVDWVRKERGMEDIDVFDKVRDVPYRMKARFHSLKYNLLTPRTVQAHCTFLSPIDLSRVQERGTSVAHCPLSNVYFSAEPFRLREALDRGVKVGLGTDIAGGYSADIMNAMRQAVAVSRMRQGSEIMQQAKNGGEQKNLAIDWKESLYLATRGGSISLGLRSGVFEVGAPFDAQMSE
jgi:guanine deaminase